MTKLERIQLPTGTLKAVLRRNINRIEKDRWIASAPRGTQWLTTVPLRFLLGQNLDMYQHQMSLLPPTADLPVCVDSSYGYADLILHYMGMGPSYLSHAA